MPKFEVCVRRTVISTEEQTGTIVVEAEDEEAARSIASQRLEEDDNAAEFDWDATHCEQEIENTKVLDVSAYEEDE